MGLLIATFIWMAVWLNFKKKMSINLNNNTTEKDTDEELNDVQTQGSRE